MYCDCRNDVFKGFVWNKGDIKRRNTLSCLDQYTCIELKLWNSRDREEIYVDVYMQRTSGDSKMAVKVD